jgi:hypothetical protein
MTNKIILKRNDIRTFVDEAHDLMQRRARGEKGFKRRLFHHLFLEKGTTILVVFNDYLLERDGVKRFQTMEDNLAFLAIIDYAHKQAMKDVAASVEYDLGSVLGYGYVLPKDIYQRASLDLAQITFGRSLVGGKTNQFSPTISFTITDADFETDKHLMCKLFLIRTYLWELSNMVRSFENPVEESGIDANDGLTANAKKLLLYWLDDDEEGAEPTPAVKCQTALAEVAEKIGYAGMRDSVRA